MRTTIGDEERFGSRQRRTIFRTIVILLLAVYAVRLGYLQIIQGNVYRLKAETQAIKQITVEPFRGNMFDRNGLLLAHNAPSFSITLTPNEFDTASIPLLSEILGMDSDAIRREYERSLQISRVKPNKIYRDTDFSIIAAIEENHEYLPGVDIVVESKRLFDFTGNMAHTIGYTREISEKQLAKEGDYYQPGDIIGYAGLEKTYEPFLRGTKGVQYVAVTASGQKVESFRQGVNDVASEEGFDLNLTIDKGLQEMAEKLMTDKRGAIVALDPNNGEVLAFVSKPDFDLREFSGRVQGNLYGKLLKDENKPLFNRATQSIYPPGSTWKMLMALAALQEGIITPSTIYNCSGGFTYGNRTWKCHHSHAHGAVNARKAIHVSCNSFFYNLGPKLGMERLTKYGRIFGFGERSHLDIPEDSPGILPSVERMNKWYGVRGWTQGRLVNLAIGQGELGVTPAQMAVYCAALANKGTIYQPHLVRSVYNRSLKRTEIISYASRKTPVNTEYFDIVQGGMFDVVNVPGGTAAVARIEGVNVCGKTGTAQNSHGQDHAWFISFAPMQNPGIALCVMVENAGYGGAVAAPIAQKLIERYLFPAKADSIMRVIDKVPLLTPPVPQPDEQPDDTGRTITRNIDAALSSRQD
ncbi:MAG: penicillin-binding protein 2 [Bacteroidetes bacterium]|nr:penicillin-binding protein 2 [Bacteroidota bacterium]